MLGEVEKCIWVDWHKKIPSDLEAKRIYFGHETCGRLLPDFKDIVHIIDFSRSENAELTFVTPFLLERNFSQVVKMLLKLHDKIETFEVVISDWGLLSWICSRKIGIPVISRFLIGQQTDFRLSGLLFNETVNDKLVLIDNKHFRLKQEIISDELKDHISSCSLLTEQCIDYFNNLGIFRFEISNVFQKVNLNNNGRNVYSLHLPFVPLSIMRWCTGENEDFNLVINNCGKRNCSHIHSKWRNNDVDKEIFRIDNALYYINKEWESKISLNQKINRVVFNNNLMKHKQLQNET